MDTEIILHEMIHDDEIENSFISPLVSIISYIILLYFSLYIDIDDYITTFISFVIIFYIFHSYYMLFREFLPVLYY